MKTLLFSRVPGGGKACNVRTSGMVLREVAAIISILVLLIFIATPATQKLTRSSKATRCLNNLRQLSLAWQAFAEDNSGRLIENYHGGGTLGSAQDHRNAPWAIGWLNWTTSPDNTNMLYLRDPRYARLSLYLLQEHNVHKCPSDNNLSSVQLRRGFKERVRSVSMNVTIGRGNAHTGPWDPIYEMAVTAADLINPAPGETTVFLEEHPDSINDPGLFPPKVASYVDLPASHHQGAANIAFADGHVAPHTWRRSLFRAPITSTPTLVFRYPPQAGDPDISWLSYHSQRVDEDHY